MRFLGVMFACSLLLGVFWVQKGDCRSTPPSPLQRASAVQQQTSMERHLQSDVDNDVRDFIRSRLEGITPDEIVKAVRGLDMEDVKGALQPFSPQMKDLFQQLNPSDVIDAIHSVNIGDVESVLNMMHYYFDGSSRGAAPQGAIKELESAEEVERNVGMDFGKFMESMVDETGKLLKGKTLDIAPDEVLRVLEGKTPETVMREVLETVEGMEWGHLGQQADGVLGNLRDYLTPEMVAEAMEKVKADVQKSL